MDFIIGGRAQGKRAWVLQTYQDIRPQDVLDGGRCKMDRESLQNCKVMDHSHLLIRRALENGQDPQELVDQLLEDNPDIVMIADEIGCGVVPTDAFEREWRECAGRICCVLAGRARRVRRIFAGLPTTLKG